MIDSQGAPDGTTQAWTQGGEPWDQAADLRTPGLTVIYHPNDQRIGERTVLEGFESTRGALLSRHVSDFAAAGAEHGRPLIEARRSRTPVVLRRVAAGILIVRGSRHTDLEVNGRLVEDTVTFPAESLDAGLVLMLGGRVVRRDGPEPRSLGGRT